MKNRIMIFSLTLMTCFCLLNRPEPAFALEHSGTISADETWLAADNPHKITANLTVNDHISLFLEPGVEVLFNGNFRIYVNGLIQAEGTSDAGIRFTRAPGVDRSQGIIIYSGAGGIFSYCLIEWAAYGVQASSSYLTAANCTFRNNTYGIYASYLNPELSDNLFENNQYGLRIDNYYAPSAKEGAVPRVGTNNVFRENDVGIQFVDCLRPSVGATAQVYDNATYGVHFQNCAKPSVAADITNSGTGIYYQNCTDIQPLDTIALLDNNGIYGAVLAQQSGPVPISDDAVIADNFAPLSIDAASFPTAVSQVPTTGNFTDGIFVTSGTSQQDAVWYNLGIPFIVTGNMAVGATGSLTIEPEVRVRLGNGAYLASYGILNINGVAGQEVRFEPHTANRWNTIAFYSGSSGTVTAASMQFASSGLYVDTSGPEVDGCRFLNNIHGYYGNNLADSFIHDSLFVGNDYGIRARSNSDPVIHQNCLDRNYSYGVSNETADTLIDAEYNFWGDASGPRHTSNSTGLGDFVSDWVDFDPWLAACPL